MDYTDYILDIVSIPIYIVWSAKNEINEWEIIINDTLSGLIETMDSLSKRTKCDIKL